MKSFRHCYIFGYVGNQDISRGSRNHQSIFVNKRYIKSKLITAAVENAMKSFLTINKFPFFILFLDIYPELIDVNVHPTKAEIKFNDERFIFKFVFDAVHKGMRETLKDTFMFEDEVTVKTPIGNNEKNEVVETISFHDIIQPSTADDVKMETVSLPIDISRNNENSYDLSQKDDNIYPQNSYNQASGASTENSYCENLLQLPNLKYLGIFKNTYILCNIMELY